MYTGSVGERAWELMNRARFAQQRRVKFLVQMEIVASDVMMSSFSRVSVESTVSGCREDIIIPCRFLPPGVRRAVRIEGEAMKPGRSCRLSQLYALSSQ
jgi:hypothetical protein